MKRSALSSGRNVWTNKLIFDKILSPNQVQMVSNFMTKSFSQINSIPWNDIRNTNFVQNFLIWKIIGKWRAGIWKIRFEETRKNLEDDFKEKVKFQVLLKENVYEKL